jgi:hypothetical protein
LRCLKEFEDTVNEGFYALKCFCNFVAVLVQLALIPLSNEGLGIGGFWSIQKAFVGALTTGGT